MKVFIHLQCSRRLQVRRTSFMMETSTQADLLSPNQKGEAEYEKDLLADEQTQTVAQYQFVIGKHHVMMEENPHPLWVNEFTSFLKRISEAEQRADTLEHL